MWADRILFGAFGVLALSRLLHPSATARTVGVVVILLLTAFVGYRYARKRRAGRMVGSVAFLAAWFTSPLLALIALIIAERVTKTAEPVAGKSREETPAARSGPPVGARFSSPYGEGVIPVLLDEDGRDVGVYVEDGPWDNAKIEQFLKWTALLRSSDRDELALRVQSEAPAPATVAFYSGRSAAIEFELMGLLQLRWAPYERFASENAQTLARLADEYLHRKLSLDLSGLRELDALVVDDLRAGGHPVLPSTILLAGSFVGEALIAMYGGKWLVRGDSAGDIWVAVRSPRGEAEANVFGKVGKLVRNGIADSTAVLAESIARLPKDRDI